MIYVVSDIHGCYDEFIKMIEEIYLTENDVLYILGDVIDREEGSFKLLDYIMSHSNIKMILGNHEDLLIRWYRSKYLKFFHFIDWYFSVINMTCYRQFKELSKSKQEEYVQFLESLPLYEILEINGEKYFLSHAGMNLSKPIKKQTRHDLLWSSEYWTRHHNTSEYTLVFGHVPVSKILSYMTIEKDGKIQLDELSRMEYYLELLGLKKKRHKNITSEINIFRDERKIAIDCGCYWTGVLGVLRVGDGKINE